MHTWFKRNYCHVRWTACKGQQRKYLEGAHEGRPVVGQLAGCGFALSCLGVGDVGGVGQAVCQLLANTRKSIADGSRLG